MEGMHATARQPHQRYSPHMPRHILASHKLCTQKSQHVKKGLTADVYPQSRT